MSVGSLKILFFVTEDWYFLSHRLPLALAAKEAGFDVVIATHVNRHGDMIRDHGLKLIPLNLVRRSQNPLAEAQVIKELIRIYSREAPDIVHHVAVKPALYGSFAAWRVGVPGVVNALGGLGFLFINPTLKTRTVRFLVERAMRFLFRRTDSRVILQNDDDVALMVGRRTINPENIRIIRGSGVDLQQFTLTPEPEGLPMVVLVSRMLWDKGVGEFVAAAEKLKASGLAARFVLVGDPDKENPAAIDDATLEAWHESGVVEYWGRRSDIPQVFQQSSIVCLPSYREGLPKVLLEAAASARPIVTTDTPGCRDVVKDGDNGFLVPVRDVDQLARAIERLALDADLRKAMGRSSREIALDFSLDKVVDQTMAIYGEFVS